MNKPETTAERILELDSGCELRSDYGAETEYYSVADLQTLAREYLKGRWIAEIPSKPGKYLVQFENSPEPEIYYFAESKWWTDVEGFEASRRVVVYQNLPAPYPPPDPFAEGCPTCGCLPGEDHDVERECGTKSESCVDCLGIGCPSCGM